MKNYFLLNNALEHLKTRLKEKKVSISSKYNKLESMKGSEKLIGKIICIAGGGIKMGKLRTINKREGMKRKRNELKDIRQRIDQIDKQITKLIAERFMFVDQLNQIKLKKNLSIIQRQRENRMFKQRKQWAREFGLSEDLIISITKLLVDASKEKQKRN